MAFVKERISEADRDLFNSFDVYDYDNSEEHTKCSPDSKWVVDREREIYFFYVSGGHHLEQHPYQQYDLVWKGKKVVMFIEKSVSRNPTPDNPMRMHSEYNIVGIRAPMEFKKCEGELISLIKKAIKSNHSVNILNSGTFPNENTLNIRITAVTSFLDEVR